MIENCQFLTAKDISLKPSEKDNASNVTLDIQTDVHAVVMNMCKPAFDAMRNIMSLIPLTHK